MPILSEGSKTFVRDLFAIAESALSGIALGLFLGAILMELPSVALSLSCVFLVLAIWRADTKFGSLAKASLSIMAAGSMALVYFLLPSTVKPAIELYGSKLITNHAPNEICLSVNFRNTGNDNAHISIYHHQLDINGQRYAWRNSITDSATVTANGGDGGDLICADGPSVVLEIQQHKPLEADLKATYRGDSDKHKHKFCVESYWDYSLNNFLGGYQVDCAPK